MEKRVTELEEKQADVKSEYEYVAQKFLQTLPFNINISDIMFDKNLLEIHFKCNSALEAKCVKYMNAESDYHGQLIKKEINCDWGKTIHFFMPTNSRAWFSINIPYL